MVLVLVYFIYLSFCFITDSEMAAALFSANLVIKANKLKFHEQIGFGGFGEVFRVTHKDWGQLAFKKLGDPAIGNE